MSAKFEFIDAQKADFPIVRMCEWVEVSTSGYYDWRDRPASATAIRREHLAALVKAVFEQSDQTYGYRRVHAQLARAAFENQPALASALSILNAGPAEDVAKEGAGRGCVIGIDQRMDAGDHRTFD